jgi:hypothetical protein
VIKNVVAGMEQANHLAALAETESNCHPDLGGVHPLKICLRPKFAERFRSRATFNIARCLKPSVASNHAMGFEAKWLASPVHPVGPFNRRLAGVAFAFATEIYLTAPGGPIRISWADAAKNALRDWFPWILLSPAAVLLANRFRFDRDHWRRNLLIHIAAIFLFAIAYEGLEMLVLPGTPSFVLSSGNGLISIGTGSSGLAGFRVSGEAPPPFSVPSNAVLFEQRMPIFSTVTAGTNMFFAQTAGGPGLPPPTTGFAGDLQGIPQPSRWTPLLHLMLGRTRLTVPIYLCIVCMCWLFNHYQEANERQRRTLELESRLTEANLQALKMQLQPHFLFNTLNTISSLIHESPALADDMVSSLSQFLRTTLEISSRNEIPLSEELEFMERYLEIQQVRFGDRLVVRRQVEPDTMNASVPPLLLQPLIENAIRHGVETREAGGMVAVLASRQGNWDTSKTVSADLPTLTSTRHWTKQCSKNGNTACCLSVRPPRTI